MFAPFFPHITEEIYQDFYKEYEDDESIHVSAWPEPILIDEEKEQAGESVKDYIAQVRAWKSEQGIALNAPIQATATYAPQKKHHQTQNRSESVIFSTLKYPENHTVYRRKTRNPRNHHRSRTSFCQTWSNF